MKHGQKIKQQILEAGVQLWHHDPRKVNHRKVASLIGKAYSTVFYHFPNLKQAVAEYALEKGDSVIIVHLILTSHELVKDMPAKEKEKHLKALRTT